MLQALVVVVDGNREDALGAVLADHVVIQRLEDILRAGNPAVLLAGDAGLGFLADDVIAQLNAFIADEHGGASNQLAHLMLRLTAEAAVKGAFRVGSAQFRHAYSCFPHGRDSPNPNRANALINPGA